MYSWVFFWTPRGFMSRFDVKKWPPKLRLELRWSMTSFVQHLQLGSIGWFGLGRPFLKVELLVYPKQNMVVALYKPTDAGYKVWMITPNEDPTDLAQCDWLALLHPGEFTTDESFHPLWILPFEPHPLPCFPTVVPVCDRQKKPEVWKLSKGLSCALHWKVGEMVVVVVMVGRWVGGHLMLQRKSWLDLVGEFVLGGFASKRRLGYIILQDIGSFEPVWALR